MAKIVVAMPVGRAEAFAYLADPGNRPHWQSSLKAVTGLEPGDPTAAGAAWTDVTVVPGVRPRMVTTRSEPPEVWAEEGTFGPFRATLTLLFEEAADGCEVTADFAVQGLGVGRLVTVASRRAVAADLRRAAAQLAG